MISTGYGNEGPGAASPRAVEATQGMAVAMSIYRVISRMEVRAPLT